jgi:hypothetical protein
MRRIPSLAILLVLAACHQGGSDQPAPQAAQQDDSGGDAAPSATLSPIDSDPDNPLIGEWTIDSGLSCNYTHLTFTQDMRVIHRAGEGEQAGRDIPDPVDTYKVAGNKVTVELVAQDPVTYVVFDNKHIGDGTENCRFHRKES